MKLPLIRQSSVSRSRDMRFKRAVRLSGEFFKAGSEIMVQNSLRSHRVADEASSNKRSLATG
jgi:hypothetical protein